MNLGTLPALFPHQRTLAGPTYVRVLRWLLAGGSMGIVFVSLRQPAAPDLPAAVVLGLMLAASEWLALRRPRSSGVVSISFVPLAAAMLVVGPQTALPLGLLSAAVGDGLVRRRPVAQVAEQASLMGLMLAAGGWLAGVPVGGWERPAWAPAALMAFWAAVFLWWLIDRGRSSGRSVGGLALGAVPLGVIATLATQEIWGPALPGPLQEPWRVVPPALLLAAGFMLVDTLATSAGKVLIAGPRGLGIWRNALLPAYYRYTGQAVAAAGLVAAYDGMGVTGLALAGLAVLLAFAVYSQYAQKQDLFVSGLCALAAALDARDPYTEGHSHRVARYSVAMAREMGLGSAATHTIELAAQLHDIGKIGIADSILLKPGKLTAEEFEIMKGHVQKGVDILWNVPGFRPAARLVEQEHERWDGSGYPNGLVGDQIAPGARIIAVADVYDALTSDRPYRAAGSTHAALGILDDVAGRELDPEPVRALRALQTRNELDSELAFGYCLTH